ncbi:MAG: LemA family protein [Candidatus Pacebacteria bacterium]|jgi:LemA protein|nr:LemA family protein [Candidatus Paceibacterota bacterium]
MTPTYIILAVLAVIVLWAITAYNGFVRLVNRTKEAWADIDVQLKRRYDLIPNLVEAVKGYATHERATLEEVLEARSKATQVHIDPTNITPAQIAAMSGVEASLGQSLGKLLAVAEAYPDLKANQNFLSLQAELADTENKIQAARRFYNGNVRDLSIAIESFPGNLIAKMFGFVKQEFFELGQDSAEREPVAVKF